MSGGVDSSVAASLLCEQGHEVHGVTLRLWGGSSDSGCCSVEDVTDAALVAAELGITHHVFNLSEEFDQHVVSPYVADHQAGLTPNPCIECNRHLKFDALLAAANRLGFEYLATGHHARVERHNDTVDLRRGVDAAKDQSYVLSMLTADQLTSLLFPVGEMTKTEVRQHGEARGLRTFNKAESQDVCFIDSRHGREAFLAERTTLTPGTVIDRDSGKPVGHVSAVELVTVGQKRGFGLDDHGRRRVVVAVKPSRAEVIVTSADHAHVSSLLLDPSTATWVHEAPPEGAELLVQVRAHSPANLARWHDTHLEFLEPVAPVAPGQTAAFYDPNDPTRVLGSVRISK